MTSKLQRQTLAPAPMTMKDNKQPHKIMLGIWLGCVALVVVTMFYGIVRYPHAPIRPRDGSYFDKAGHEFTEAQFQTFKTWEYCLFGSFGVVGILSIPLALSGRSRRKGA